MKNMFTKKMSAVISRVMTAAVICVNLAGCAAATGIEDVQDRGG